MYNLFFLSFSVQINVKIEALQLGLRSRSFPDIRRYAIQLELRVCVDFLLPNIQSSSSLLDRISAAAMKNVEQRPKKSNIKGDFQAFELALKLAKIFFLFSQHTVPKGSVIVHCPFGQNFARNYFAFKFMFFFVAQFEFHVKKVEYNIVHVPDCILPYFFCTSLILASF